MCNDMPTERFVKNYLSIAEKLNYPINSDGYKHKGIWGMNLSPNSVQLADNPQFRKGFDVKNIFKPYPLITDGNLHLLTECVNHLVRNSSGFHWVQY